MSGLWLSSLTLSAFRNYVSAKLTLPPGPVVLTGENGAGKTNCLEALSLLSPGRGMRRAAYEDMLHAGGGAPWAVSAVLETPDGPVRIGTGLKAGAGLSQRVVRVDGEPASINSLGEHLQVLWLVPAMDGLFTGAAGDRRRFIDRLVLAADPGHAARVTAFERVMRDRNRVLEDACADPAWLDALETQLSEQGVAVAIARRDAVARLSLTIERIRKEYPGDPFPFAEIGMAGDFEMMIARGAAVEAEDEYRAVLHSERRRDRAAGRTLSGPHRSDLIVRHGPKQMEARLCSTGEQKALLIGLILAHAMNVATLHNGRAPLLLLDEVAAHLDSVRRGALFSRILAMECQAFMTGTDTALFNALGGEAAFFSVENGVLRPVPDG